MRSLPAFLLRVLAGFRRNQGLLLSGAVAYYTLLSIVPLFVLLLVGLSHVADQQRLLDTVQSNLALLVPGQAAVITRQVENFLEHREVVGAVGLLALLFFSTTAFTILENAMFLIFHHRGRVRRRHFLVSAILPYLFIMLIGMGLLLITVISAALQAVGPDSIQVFGYTWTLGGASGALLYALGVIGLALLLTAVYVVLPVGGISIQQAWIGGVTATLLWELTRHVLVWYFAKLSMVNLIYGSLAATVVVLLTLEAGALILLLGAQVIAEIDREREPVEEATGATSALAAPQITLLPHGSRRESPHQPTAPPPGSPAP
ncbi:MAG TPA: YihY/virulence factor BrkB family protein [Candidatus Methylomirabilis sp.]|nr:YihY/virulence factor BrkB family protein [Candidatus Methylomirabilis sp.]